MAFELFPVGRGVMKMCPRSTVSDTASISTSAQLPGIGLLSPRPKGNVAWGRGQHGPFHKDHAALRRNCAHLEFKPQRLRSTEFHHSDLFNSWMPQFREL